MIVYNPETNEIGILEGILVRIVDEGNIFKAYIPTMWFKVGNLY